MSAECMTVHCHNQHNYITSKTDVKTPKADGKISLEVLTAVLLRIESLLGCYTMLTGK